jgi:hypothetical protein
VRIRIALATALAVLVIPAVLFTFFFTSSSSVPAASARTTHVVGSRHEAASRHRSARIGMKLMSYSEARKVAKLATFYNTVTAHEEANYFKEVTFLTALAAQQAAAAATQQAAAAAAAAAARAQAAATPAPAPAPAGGGADAMSTNTADWACIRQHESGGNYSEGGGGAYQFELGTWEGLTGLGTPAQDSPPAVQDAAALRLYSERGWEPWTTRYVCGL